MDYCFVKGTSPRLLVFFHGTGGNKDPMLFLRQQLDLVDFEMRLSAFLDFWQDWTSEIIVRLLS